MAKHRVCTTISKKHWELLKKHTAKFVTQQKALEAALESLENNSNRNHKLSPEEKLWMRIGKDLRQNLCLVHKEIIKVLMRTADFEQLNKVVIGLKLSEYQIAFYRQKPLKECSLDEVMDGIVYTLKIVNLFDAINYTDVGSYYSLGLIHTLGTGNTDATMSFKLIIQDFFQTYGVKTESRISENSLFMKIYKNSKLLDK